MSPPSPSVEARSDDDDDDDIVAEINMTPLTDVVLVLLIIFMVSSSAIVDAARQGHVDVALPQASAAPKASEGQPTLVIGLAPDGRLFVREKFVSDAELMVILKDAYAKSPGTVVIVDADGAMAHRSVVQIIDRVRAAGFATVGLGAQAAAEP